MNASEVYFQKSAAIGLAGTFPGFLNYSQPNTSDIWSDLDGQLTANNTSASSVDVDRSHVIKIIIVGLILSVFILLALAGNTLVIVAITTDRNLRKTSNYFLISLAVADTLVAVAVMPFAVANDLTDRWYFSSIFCDVWISSDVMCSTASILSLCSVSIDRYIYILDPLRYRNLVTHRRALMVVGLLWVMSALLSFLPIQLGWHRLNAAVTERNVTHHVNKTFFSILPTASSDFIYRSNATSVDWNWNDSSDWRATMPLITSEFYRDNETEEEVEVEGGNTCHLRLNPWYAVVSSMISFYIPCIVMIVIYFRLYRFAQKHVRTINRSSKATQPSSSWSSPPPAASTSPSARARPVNDTTTIDRNRARSTTELCAAAVESSVSADGRLAPPNYFSLQRRSSDDVERGESAPKQRERDGCNSVESADLLLVRRSSLLEKIRFRRRYSDSFNPCIEGSPRSGVWNSRRILLVLRRKSYEGSSSEPTIGDISTRRNSNRDCMVAGRSGNVVYKLTDHKAAITVGIIMGVFLLCWSPFFTINIVGSFCADCIPSIVFTVFSWFGYINSSMNPIIYGVSNQEYRQAFKRVLLGRCFRHQVPTRRDSGLDDLVLARRRLQTNGRSNGGGNYLEVKTHDHEHDHRLAATA